MATPTRGALHRLLERAHSPDTASQIFTEKIHHREQFLRPTSPGREERLAADAAAGTTQSAAASSLAAAAAASTAAELAAAGAQGHNGRDARRRARRIKQEQRQHRAKALKPKPLSSRQRREIEKKAGDEKQLQKKTSYAAFLPLHRLWLGYIREVLGAQDLRTGGAGAAAKLTAADFHGALVEVTRSACVGRVGTRGIVVRDTRFVFEIVTAKNDVKMVPKDGSFFRIEIPVEDEGSTTEGSAATDATKDDTRKATPPANTPKLIIEILGSQFMHRAADRAGRKFKQHFYKEL
ncbi:RNase P/RNase MRP complex subunit [Sporothrix stenoceras]|uniref:Ribonuclease P protein subunit n=1 Tax=Sporothrix stenoceras TaxID=5173 RepID=A0ABR3ZNR6_9PEZI